MHRGILKKQILILLGGSFSLVLACVSNPKPVNPFVPDHSSPHETISSSTENPELKIVVLDIGQGDATLVMGPNGKNILIDGGPPESGKTIILPYLEKHGIKTLHWILVTHYDLDHIGGIPEIVRGADQVSGTNDDYQPVFGFLDRGSGTAKDLPAYHEYLQVSGNHRAEVQVGDVFTLGQNTEMEMIIVNGQYPDGSSIHLNPDEENSSSIGTLIRHQDFRYFSAGDLTGGGFSGNQETKDLETRLAPLLGRINVLHISHHGSQTSTNDVFLSHLLPQHAVISCGKNNDYGHPHKKVLERLQKHGVEIFRTDERGFLEIKSDGASPTVITTDATK